MVSCNTCPTGSGLTSAAFLRAPAAARASTSRLWMNERRCTRWGRHVCSIHLALTGAGAVSAFQLVRECRRERQSASCGVDTCFQSPGSVLSRGLSGSRDTSTFDLLMKHQAVFHTAAPLHVPTRKRFKRLWEYAAFFEWCPGCVSAAGLTCVIQ